MNPFDRDVAELIRLLKTLVPAEVWKVFACSAERWFPVYNDFVEEFKWGDSRRYRELLDTLWAGGNPRTLSDSIASARGLAPHADDFDNLKASLAQNACICLTSAAEWMVSDHQRTPAAIEYSLESVKTVVCVEMTGCLDLGTHGENGNALDEIVRDVRYQSEREMILASIKNVARSRHSLKSEAILRAWSFSKLRLQLSNALPRS